MEVYAADTSTMALDFPDSDPLSPTFIRIKRIPSHSLSSASSDNSTTSRKGRHAEPGTTEVHSGRASISMPPPTGRPIIKSRPSSTISYRRPSEASDYWAGGAGSPRPESAIEDFETPKLVAGSMPDLPKHPPLPGAALRPQGSTTDFDTKRMSTSSIYSLSSARAKGEHSSTASANGSETGIRPTSGSMSGGKALGISQPEISTSALSVTTSTMSNQGSSTSHQLTTREPTTADVPRRSTTSRADNTGRSNIPRSRSRAQRRISSSTAPSSHSPSSDRGMLLAREKEEGIDRQKTHGRQDELTPYVQ
jgi:inositol-hexakisphosphate/diphosphoinositol-pentakisphosphate 1-kinase